MSDTFGSERRPSASSRLSAKAIDFNHVLGGRQPFTKNLKELRRVLHAQGAPEKSHPK